MNTNSEAQCTIILSDAERELVRARFASIDYDPYGSTDYISQLRQAAYQTFPVRLLHILDEQRQATAPKAYIVLENLPIDSDIKGSPRFTETGRSFKSGVVSENVIAALSALLGEPYSIAFEGQELVNNLTPQPETKNDYTGLGSEVELDFHIENAALRLMSEDDCSPAGLILMGVRHDPLAPKTYVCDARRALQHLSEEDIEVLYSRSFVIRLPYRWRNTFDAKSENTGLCALISGPRDLPRLSGVFYPDMVLAVNQCAKMAMDRFHAAIKKESIGLDITPGRAVYIDNRFTLHAREKFSPTYDENGWPYRWLHRVFVASNLWAFRSFQKNGARVFDPSKKAS